MTPRLQALLVHGLGATPDWWSPFRLPLERLGVEAEALPLPDVAEGGPEAWVEATLARLPSGPVVLVGHSLGAAVCQLACPLCARTLYRGADDVADLPVESFQRLVAACPEAEEVIFVGLGEPLLHPGLEDMVRTCAGRGLATHALQLRAPAGARVRPGTAPGRGLERLRDGRLATRRAGRESCRLPSLPPLLTAPCGQNGGPTAGPRSPWLP